MGYVPSAVARSLTANRTWTIGMVVATISDPFMGRIVEGVEQVAIEAGFNVILSTSQNDRQREIAVIDVLQQRRVDGLIVIASHLFDHYRRYFDRINELFYHISSFMTMREANLWRWSHARHHTDTIIVMRDPEIQVKRPADLLKIAGDFF